VIVGMDGDSENRSFRLWGFHHCPRCRSEGGLVEYDWCPSLKGYRAHQWSHANSFGRSATVPHMREVTSLISHSAAEVVRSLGFDRDPSSLSGSCGPHDSRDLSVAWGEGFCMLFSPRLLTLAQDKQIGAPRWYIAVFSPQYSQFAIFV
jgi:hypothetical protein